MSMSQVQQGKLQSAISDLLSSKPDSEAGWDIFVARIESLFTQERTDAERYRWLRENLLSAAWLSGKYKSGSTYLCPVGDANTAGYWDSAIDAALRAQPTQTKEGT